MRGKKYALFKIRKIILMKKKYALFKIMSIQMYLFAHKNIEQS
jgi:hypothetical protein